MPNFHFTKEQARALTFYMLSLTSEQMGTYYSSVRLIPSPDTGGNCSSRRIASPATTLEALERRAGRTWWESPISIPWAG